MDDEVQLMSLFKIMVQVLFAVEFLLGSAGRRVRKTFTAPYLFVQPWNTDKPQVRFNMQQKEKLKTSSLS